MVSFGSVFVDSAESHTSSANSDACGCREAVLSSAKENKCVSNIVKSSILNSSPTLPTLVVEESPRGIEISDCQR